MYFKTFEKAKCCACTACEHVCPTKSINFKFDNEGFKYPEIDKNTCVDCGLCEKVCPIENTYYTNHEQPLIYAAKLKDVEQVKRSTSGGIFYAIAKHIIEKGGAVYGAAFDKDLRLRHIRVENMAELDSLRGSKYIQSNLEDIFLDIKDQLTNHRWVYFVGTGCQVAGLKSFLKKDYETLLTSDLVCHGVPSQKMFDMHLQYLKEKYRALKVVKYQFRDNERGIGSEIVDLVNVRGKKVRISNPSYEISPFLYSFMYSMTLRPSCYECPFARIPRQGDITLADYWGAKQFFPHLDISNGMSLVLLNNIYGIDVWNAIKHETINEIGNIDKAAEYNGNLLRPTFKPEIRNEIYDHIEKYGYNTTARTLFRSPNFWKIRFVNVLTNGPVLKHIYAFIVRVKNYYL